MNHDERLLVVPESHAGLRVDVALQQLLPEFSRSKLQEWIKNELVTVNQSAITSKYKIEGIPTKILIDKNGKIVSFGSSEEDLSIQIEDQLSL